MLVVVHVIFHLVLTLVHSFPFPTQVDCYFERLIVGISPPAVLAVAAASSCSGRVLVSAQCSGMCASSKADCTYLFILLLIGFSFLVRENDVKLILANVSISS